jgi:HEAT repeat protein
MIDIRTIDRLLTQVAALVVILLALSSVNGQERIVETAADESILRGSGQNTDRAAAARRLGFSGNSKAEKVLLEFVTDANTGVSVEAILGLGQLRSKRSAGRLIEIVEKTTNSEIKRASIFSLGLIGDRKAVGTLIPELESSDPLIKRNVIVSLGLLGDSRAVEPLLGLPHDDDHSSCAPVAIALGQIKSDTAIPRLFEWLNGDDFEVCTNAAIALVMIGGKKQVTPLLAALKSENAITRASAAFALGRIKDRRAFNALIGLLKDRSKRVVLNTIAALENLGDRRAVSNLQILTDNTATDPEISSRARKAIEALIAGYSSRS